MTDYQEKLNSIRSHEVIENGVTPERARPEYVYYCNLSDPEMLAELGDGDWDLGWEKHPGICITAEQRKIILDLVFAEFAGWIARGVCYDLGKAEGNKLPLSKRLIFTPAVLGVEATLGHWIHEYTGDMQAIRLHGNTDLHWMVYGEIVYEIMWNRLLDMIWYQLDQSEQEQGGRRILDQLFDDARLIPIFRSLWALVCQTEIKTVVEQTRDLIVRFQREIQASPASIVTSPPQVFLSPVIELG